MIMTITMIDLMGHNPIVAVRDRYRAMSGLEGTTLGRYHLRSLLGQGGMSEVYLAYDELMQREVAIKVLSNVNTIGIVRFRREAAAIGRLSHDHILPAFDYGEHGPWHYLVMPYIEGTTLRDLLAQGALAPEEAADILVQVADALQYAHDHQIIHRDIKPSNILIRADYHVYLADFGLAKSLEELHDVTQSGTLLGTPEYMAPDLAQGPATISSDIYALGVLLYQMIAGRVPFIADTPLAVYMKQLHEEPLPPSYWNPALPPELDAVVLRALEKLPERRYQSGTALANAYLRALERIQNKCYRCTDNQAQDEPVMPLAIRNAVVTSVAYVSPLPVLPQHVPMAEAGRLRLSNRITLTTDANVESLDKYGLQVAVGDTIPVSPPALPSHTPTRRRYTRHKDAIVASVITAGILLFVVLPMSCIYYLYSTSHSVGKDPARYAGKAISSITQPTPAVHIVHVHSGTPVPHKMNTPMLLISDSLTQEIAGRWTQGSACNFANGGYVVSVFLSDYLQPCILNASVPGAIKVSVNVTLISGHDAGILLNLQGQHFYDFEITEQRAFFFRRHDESGPGYVALIPDTVCNAIKTGQQNTLTVIDDNGDFQLYINGTFVGEVHDTTYSGGQIALDVGTLTPETSGAALFSNFFLFQLGQ
jgi:serine/threonine protein kinase